MNILLSGASGFVGRNILYYFTRFSSYDFRQILKQDLYSNSLSNIFNQNISDVILHLAGKAHDLKNVSSSNEYYKVNTELTKDIFDAFLASDAKVFITLSSVKAVADEVDGELTEDVIPNPITHYGKSKLLAEHYILSQPIPDGKRVYILRPCMIHGPGNKGNLNLLYSLVSKGFPWPLGLFENSRSYLSIENLCFIIKELVEREDIQSGVYNVSDNVPLSTNEVIKLIAESQGENPRIFNINKTFISVIARLGDLLMLPLNSERLHKLTDSYVVSNAKIKAAIGKSFPVSSRDGLMRTFQSLAKNV